MSNETKAPTTAAPNLPLIRLDPAADPDEPEEAATATREVTTAEDRAIGATVTNSPQWNGASVVEACSEPLVDANGDTYTAALAELALDLKAKFAKVQEGDLSDPEAMLLAQAHALQAIFSKLALKGLAQTSLPSMQMCMSVALKAQAQSRATLTALADMKHPRQPNFIGQQNIAATQQVNNSAPPIVGAAEIENRQIKLLEAEDGERLDTAEKSAAGGADKALEAVGKIQRTEDDSG